MSGRSRILFYASDPSIDAVGVWWQVEGRGPRSAYEEMEREGLITLVHRWEVYHYTEDGPEIRLTEAGWKAAREDDGVRFMHREMVDRATAEVKRRARHRVALWG